MDTQSLYRSKHVTIPEAVGKIKSHQTVGVAMAASEPPGLLSELGNHRDRLDDVHVWVCLPLGSYSFVLDPSMEGHFFIENWFYGAADRKVHAQGRESYIPNNLHQASTRKLYASKNKVNVFIGTATPPDSRGYMSLSLGLVLERQLIDAADVVILEINENLPWTLGDTQVHLSEVDYLVENNAALPQLPVVPPSEAEEKIGGYIAELIDDGSTLQLGIGGIPNAITPFMMKRKEPWHPYRNVHRWHGGSLQCRRHH